MEYHSIWDQTKLPQFPEQTENVSCDICIVGGGLCGLAVAYELIAKGVNPHGLILIDAKRVGGGTTRHSTAKLTAQHGLIYHRLIQQQGVEKAAQYAQANLHAIHRAQEIAKDLDIHGVVRLPSYIYATTTEQRNRLEQEATAARALGLDAEITLNCELPFNVEMALKMNHQACIDPGLYIKSLVESLVKKGCTIYENTTALYLKDNVVVTDKGNIFAQKVVISTRFPFADKHGLYFAKLYQQRSYLLLLDRAQAIKGCYIGADNDGLSFRPFGNKLIVCGIADENGMYYEGYYDLIRRVVDLYPDCIVEKKWSAEDCMTHDGIPYIGRYHSLSGEVYLATGFNKWGISSSFVAGQILSEQILRGYAEYEEVFSPSRSLIPGGMKSFFVHSAEIAAEFAADWFHVPKKKENALSVGESDVVFHNGKKVCASKRQDGLHEAHHHCSHMGCSLTWNASEQVWDCPCHGSRFDIDGRILSGPAQKEISISDENA